MMLSEHKFGDVLYGYTGKILRVDLSDSTFTRLPTTDYVPRFIGGEAVAAKIFWDEVRPGVTAYDPENELIFMTGATCGTGMPISNRMSVCGISPNALPEQFTHSNMGGFFSGMLKFAGYDGIVVTGKAPRHTYVFIHDEQIEFLDADFLWGEYVHETQEKIFAKHGKDAHSVVIGPAGENLHRNATVTTSNDSASAKAGFGAVMGAKNLKAIAVRGTGSVRAAHPEKIMELHKTVGYPLYQPNPLREQKSYYDLPLEKSCHFAQLSCGYGCNRICLNTYFDLPDVLHPGETTAAVAKCIDPQAVGPERDCRRGDWNNIHSRRQENPRGPVYEPMHPYEGEIEDRYKPAFSGSFQYNKLRINDTEDPMLPEILTVYQGDQLNYYKPNAAKGMAITVLCNQYGLDKWDITVWYMSWLSMTKQEGLLDELDFGMEVDVNDERFMTHFIHMMTYREGELGNIFAEGMARAIRMLGKEKYGDSIYHNRYSQDGTVQLDLPVSLETAWGHCAHYQGRGWQGTPQYAWIIYTLICMADSRDAVCNHHIHDWVENYVQYRDDPCHSPVMAKAVVKDEIDGMLKDSLVTCEWKSPCPGWENMESEMYNAVTGLDVTEEELYEAADAANLLYRAILMRNFGRTRDMEVDASYPFLTYPDPFGKVCSWDEWNDAVDLYYKERGYDLATGWPTRATWEKHGLSDVADEMERLHLLPPAGGTGYQRKANPFTR